jgi:Na+/H+ antiporter NhaC
MWLLGAIVTSAIVFYLLQQSDDKKADRNGVPRAARGKKVATLFFITVLCVIVFYWFGANTQSADVQKTGGSKPGAVASMPAKVNALPSADHHLLETHMIKSIREDVHVGGAPF